MGVIWLSSLTLLSVVAWSQSAAVPTAETMVVARSDVAVSTALPVSTELTTSEPPLPIKLTEMLVTSAVKLRYAKTEVVTNVRNPATVAQETTFRVLLPETAFISGFVMILNGTSYKAYVKEKNEASQIYNQAVSHGIAAAHVATKARDSNHFTVSVNVEPNTEAVFKLNYEELLIRRNGVYNHAINLHPGVVVPKLSVTVDIKETQKINTLRVPEVRTGNEVDATEDDAQNSKAVIKRGADGKEATITFNPDLEEQKRLMDIYAEKSKESRQSQSWYNPYATNSQEPKPEGVLGQFVVQYDVDRPKDGEILVNDGYFVHFFVPPNLPSLSKHVVFVLDTSGSMLDRKITQLKEAMKSILSDLNTHDYFSIVEFSSSIQVHDLKEALEDKPPRRRHEYEFVESTKLIPPSRATKDNVDKAKIIIDRLVADGGTNIDAALAVAVDLIRKGVRWTPLPPSNITEAPTPVPLVTEKQKTSSKQEAEKTEIAKTETAKTEKEDLDKPEPIIIFLTDGQPTIGEIDPRRIISRLSEKNEGVNKATIFSLAFGEDADRGFLRKISLQNEGFMRHIYEASDAALQLRDFYRQVSSPLLSRVTFVYPTDQVKEGSVTKSHFRTFYAGSEAIVAGIVDEKATEISPVIDAFCGVDDEDGKGRKKYKIFPKVPVVSKRKDFFPLERLWAHLTIKQLLDERDAADDGSDDKKRNQTETTPEKKALQLALKYEFVTPLTSLVVVKPNGTKAVDAESVDKVEGLPGVVQPLAASYASPIAPLYGVQMQSNYFGLHGKKRSWFSSGVPRVKSSILRHNPDESSFPYHDKGPPASSYSMIAGFPGQPGQPGAADLPEQAFEQENFDYDFSTPAETLVSSPTPKINPTPTQVIVSSPPQKIDPPSTSKVPEPSIADNYPWTVSLLDSNKSALTFEVNATKVVLNLSSQYKSSSPDTRQPCPSAVTTKLPGVCLYLTHCDEARNITAQEYASTYCLATDGLAGVCCPGSNSGTVVPPAKTP